MPTITVDTVPREAGEGLKEPELLLGALNRLMQEAGAALNGGPTSGLTLFNARKVVLAEKEVVTPAEWTALTPLNGFTDTGPADGYGALSVLKQADGTAWLQGRVQRASGSPAAFTPIARLPEGYAPASTQRRVGDAAGSHAVWEVDSGGVVRWVAGAPTTSFYVSSSWVAVDKGLPAWPTPLRVRLPVKGKVGVRQVLVAARTTTASEPGVPSVCTVYSPAVERPGDEDFPQLVIPRIDGLRESTRYRLTLWAFLE